MKELLIDSVFTTNREDYNIIDERRLWVHKDIDLDDIYRQSNSLYVYTKPSDFLQKMIVKIGETGSLNGDRSVKDRIYEQPNSTDTEPILLLFVLDCKKYVESGILKNAKELEFFLHKYFDDKHWLDGAGTEWFQVPVSEVIKLIRIKIGDDQVSIKPFNPHFLQEVSIRQFLDLADENKSVNIIAELCARFGKTLTYLELFKRLDVDIMILPSYMHSVFSSFENEIVGKYNDEKIGKWTNFAGYKVINTIEDENWIQKFQDNLGKNKLIVFVSIQTPTESLSKFDCLRDLSGDRKLIVIDEADFGAYTEKSKEVIHYINSVGDIPYRMKIITSGTGIEKASHIFMDQEINDVVSVSYTEMLLTKRGESKFFLEEYLDEISPNSKLYEFLKTSKKDWSNTLSYAPDINFFKLVLPEKHRQEIESSNLDEDLTGWNKLLSDVNKNINIIKPIINGLWGKSKNVSLDTLAISNAIGYDPKVVQFFTASPSNDELNKLANLFRTQLPNHIIRVLSGQNDVKNATAEIHVKHDIKRCKVENKDGVVILSTNMGSRSFSVSETDAVILMYDNGSSSATIQKISRALTGGKNFYGDEKTCGNVISLSLDPNRVDAVDLFLVEEAIKNKTKSESIDSVLRRIRRSVNIFAIDDNGDKINLLVNDEYYSELLNKFNFERLKNSQINITPLISDADLRNDLLDIKSSELSKNDKKVKQLKGKGNKFLNSNESNYKDDKDKEDLEKVDINLLRQAILTINNSILSIISIDNSIEDKSKSFRSILKSINSDVDKAKEFYELFGIRPSVVIRLMDKEVINEQIIDICISKF
jgi:hypothetical protein